MSDINLEDFLSSEIAKNEAINYTDTKAVELQTYTDTAKAESIEYTDSLLGPQIPGKNSNKDLSTGSDNITVETPFESGGTDAFGIAISGVYDCMTPSGSLETLNYGSGEAYVGENN